MLSIVRVEVSVYVLGLKGKSGGTTKCLGLFPNLGVRPTFVALTKKCHKTGLYGGKPGLPYMGYARLLSTPKYISNRVNSKGII